MTHLASLRRSFPTVRLLLAPFRWIGQSRRRVWCTFLVLLAIVAGPPLWWATQLWGLPDIGDPFDVAAFRAMTIPDDRNAFVLYRRAADLLKPLKMSKRKNPGRVNWFAPWSEAEPEFRGWVEENRVALALYREGAEMPDALDPSPLFSQERERMTAALSTFQRLALLEASRLEEQGDMAGAWNWYRAALRTIHQVRVYGTAPRRFSARDWHGNLRRQLNTWAAEPRTTPALLRQALDDVIACEALVPSESYTLKSEYVDLDRLFNEARNSAGRVPPPWGQFLRFSDYQLSPEMWGALDDAGRFWRVEKERSRRVVRLVTANWLACCDLPPDQRPDPDPNVASHDFYSFGPGAPAKARVLSPETLDQWLGTTDDAQYILKDFSDVRSLRIREHADQRALVILMGSQLYLRDHGTDPPEPEALVGPYLKRLPAEFPDDEKYEPNSGTRGTDIDKGQGPK
ncbi:MAG: hypothetical protein ACLQIB_54185 [Isosphaeraceae bacterium]